MSKQIDTGQRKKFTTDLYRFLERYLIRSENKDAAPSVSVDPIDAEAIKLIDSNEEYCHVQYESFAGEPLKEPRIWWINAWRSSYLKWQLDKSRAEQERKEANLLVENRDRVAKAMAKEYGLDISIFQGIAFKIAKKKVDKAAEQYKTKIDRG